MADDLHGEELSEVSAERVENYDNETESRHGVTLHQVLDHSWYPKSRNRCWTSSSMITSPTSACVSSSNRL